MNQWELETLTAETVFYIQQSEMRKDDAALVDNYINKSNNTTIPLEIVRHWSRDETVSLKRKASCFF